MLLLFQPGEERLTRTAGDDGPSGEGGVLVQLSPTVPQEQSQEAGDSGPCCYRCSGGR